MAVRWRILVYSIVSAGVRGGWHAVLAGFPTRWLIANEVGTRLMSKAGYTAMLLKIASLQNLAEPAGEFSPSGLYTYGRTIRVTPGHDGQSAVRNRGTIVTVPDPPVNCVDTHGAHFAFPEHCKRWRHPKYANEEAPSKYVKG
jgi:hypothetical protein